MGENLAEKEIIGRQLQPAPCRGELRPGVDLDVMELLHGENSGQTEEENHYKH